MRRPTRCGAALLLALVGLLAAGCSPAPAPAPLEAVRVQLKWVHQAQFAGLYLAQDRGLYAAEGLAVELVEGGPGILPLDRLRDGAADLAVGAPEDLLLRRAAGEPLVAVATVFRKNPLLFIAKEDSGIRSPRDFPGKTLTFAGDDGEVIFRAMLGKLGIDPATVTLVPYDYSYETFYGGAVQVVGTYSIGGLLRMQAAGHKVRRIWPSDYGVHFYSDTVMATETTCRERGALVTRFLRASLQGWRLAVEEPAAAVEATLARARQKDRALQAAMLNGALPLVHTGRDRLGQMDLPAWEAMAAALNTYLAPSPPVRAAGAADLRFLTAAYGAQ